MRLIICILNSQCCLMILQAAFLQGSGLYPYAGGAGLNPVSLTRAELTSIVGLTGSKLYLYKLKTQELVDQVAVEAMNETMAGEGFNFDFTPKKEIGLGKRCSV